MIDPGTWEYYFEDHDIGNLNCEWCGENYPMEHDCGGLIHYQIIAMDYETYIYIRCDKCGFEEEL